MTTAAQAVAVSGADRRCCPALTAAELGEETRRAGAVFATLGDPVRLRLLSIVAPRARCAAAHLEGPLGQEPAHRLAPHRVLAEAGLIEGDKRGRWTWWRIVPGQMQRLRDLLDG